MLIKQNMRLTRMPFLMKKCLEYYPNYKLFKTSSRLWTAKGWGWEGRREEVSLQGHSQTRKLLFNLICMHITSSYLYIKVLNTWKAYEAFHIIKWSLKKEKKKKIDEFIVTSSYSSCGPQWSSTPNKNAILLWFSLINAQSGVFVS